MSSKNVAEIAKRNDALRALIPLISKPNTLLMTRGVAALPPDEVAAVMERVKGFNDFTEDNDPWGEHDFGSFEVKGKNKIFWKIDDYQGTDGYELVLTVML